MRFCGKAIRFPPQDNNPGTLWERPDSVWNAGFSVFDPVSSSMPLCLHWVRYLDSAYYGNCSSPVCPCEDMAAGPASPSPSKGVVFVNPQAA